jgi:hypothetical protein
MSKRSGCARGFSIEQFELDVQDTRPGMKRGDKSSANAPAQLLRRRVERPRLSLGAHEHQRKPKRRNRWLAHVAAAVAVLLHCACSLLVHAAAQKVVSESLGTWSTANLSEARSNLAATSLPNEGLAIFAGGQGTSCDFYCDDCREGCGVRGMCVWEGDCMRGRSVVWTC